MKKGSFASITAIVAIMLLSLTLALSLNSVQYSDSAKTQLVAREMSVRMDNIMRLLDKATTRSLCENNGTIPEEYYQEIMTTAEESFTSCTITVNDYAADPSQPTGKITCSFDTENGNYLIERVFSFSKTIITDPISGDCIGVTDYVSGKAEWPLPPHS